MGLISLNCTGSTSAVFKYVESNDSRATRGPGRLNTRIGSLRGPLPSDAASFSTGAIVPVDGGLSASNGQPKLS